MGCSSSENVNLPPSGYETTKNNTAQKKVDNQITQPVYKKTDEIIDKIPNVPNENENKMSNDEEINKIMNKQNKKIFYLKYKKMNNNLNNDEEEIDYDEKFYEEYYGKEFNATLIIKIIWIDKKINETEYLNYKNDLSDKGYEVNSFDNVDEGIECLKNGNFEIIFVIISQEFYLEYNKKISKEINKLLNYPITIIFDSNISNDDNLFINEKFKTFNDLLNFMTLINETDLNSKDDCCDINYNNIFTFEEISSPKNLILPSLYNEISLSNTDITDSEIQNFHNILTENHPNYQILTLIAPFIQINKNLIPNILCKFWARCYTFESSFYRVMNNSLMKGEWDNYNIFIKMMYKGIKLKSLTSSFNKKFYRGQLISKVEYDNIYNSINNNNKQLIYSRCFLSFSTDESVAHSFLNESHKDNIVSILLVINSSVNNDETYTSNTDVKEFSFFEGEEEVLFFPYSSFVVDSIEEINYYKQINLSYLGVYKNEIKEEYKNIKDINEFLNKMQNDKFFKDIGGIKNKNNDGNLENMKEYFKKEIKKIIEKKKEEIENEENLKINVEYNGTISSLYVPPYKNVKYLKELIKKTHPKNFDVDRLIYHKRNISQNEDLILKEIFKNKLSINVKIVEKKK